MANRLGIDARQYFLAGIDLTTRLNEILGQVIAEFAGRVFYTGELIERIQEARGAGEGQNWIIKVFFASDPRFKPAFIIKEIGFCYNLQMRPTHCLGSAEDLFVGPSGRSDRRIFDVNTLATLPKL